MKPNTAATIVILGLARQGKALAGFFAGLGWRVIASDVRTAEALRATLDELRDLPIEYALGGHPTHLLDGCDLLCLSGGVPANLPIVLEAQKRGIPVSNDAQEFLLRCPAPVIGITGSAGKTTTTTLVGDILQTAGFTTWVGGNIGNPLIGDLAAIRPDHRVVMELSSFQLELMRISPQVSGVLNITPNHLDRHKTMEAYITAKRHIVAHQRPSDIAVLGYDEPNTRALAAATAAQVRYFSGQDEVETGAFLRGGPRPRGKTLVLSHEGREIEVVQRDDIQLRGFHNVMNILAAIALADAAGAPVEAIRQAITAFTSVEHRLEVVRRRDGVLWINDSIATAPERVLAALNSFEEPLILLAGGRDKDLPWQEFADAVVRRVRAVVLFGEAADLIGGHIEAALRRAEPAHVVLKTVIAAGTLKNAVHEAAKIATAGDVVLLSPGGTSFDAYQDFAARGEHFRQLVGAL